MTTRAKLLLAATILLPLALTACGQERPALALPPAELATCKAEPETPVLPAPGLERDRIVFDYILSLRDAWGDCASKVAGLKVWRETAAD